MNNNRDIVRDFAKDNPSDISEHLLQIYDVVVKRPVPRIIVELGVRNGMSTFTLSRAAKDIGAILISVDSQDCSKACDWGEWKFIRIDDLKFEWTRKGKIDILFIDTVHTFDHTKKELEKFLPLMNNGGIIMMHDTNNKSKDCASRNMCKVGDAIDYIFGSKGKWNTNFEVDNNINNKVDKIVNRAHNNGMAYIFLK